MAADFADLECEASAKSCYSLHNVWTVKNHKKDIRNRRKKIWYDEDGNLERYNIFSTRMLVRCDADGKLYLYDLVRTKKETSKPHEQ